MTYQSESTIKAASRLSSGFIPKTLNWTETLKFYGAPVIGEAAG